VPRSTPGGRRWSIRVQYENTGALIEGRPRWRALAFTASWCSERWAKSTISPQLKRVGGVDSAQILHRLPPLLGAKAECPGVGRGSSRIPASSAVASADHEIVPA